MSYIQSGNERDAAGFAHRTFAETKKMEQKALRWGVAVGALAGVESAVFMLAPREEAALLATLCLIFAAFVAAAALRFHLFIPEAGQTRQSQHPYFRSYPSLRA